MAIREITLTVEVGVMYDDTTPDYHRVQNEDVLRQWVTSAVMDENFIIIKKETI